MMRRMSSYSAALSRAVAPMCQTLLRLKIWAQSDETCSARLLRGSQVARQQTDSTRVVPIAAVCAISLVVPPSTNGKNQLQFEIHGGFSRRPRDSGNVGGAAQDGSANCS